MASASALRDESPPASDAFCDMLQEVSRGLSSQVRLAGGCLALHPCPPPGYKDSTGQALAKLHSALSEFWWNVAQASSSATPAPSEQPVEPAEVVEDIRPEQTEAESRTRAFAEASGIFEALRPEEREPTKRARELAQALGFPTKEDDQTVVPHTTWADAAAPKTQSVSLLSLRSVPEDLPPEPMPAVTEPISLLNESSPEKRLLARANGALQSIAPEDAATKRRPSFAESVELMDGVRATADSGSDFEDTVVARPSKTASSVQLVRSKSCNSFTSRQEELVTARISEFDTPAQQFASADSMSSLKEDENMGEPFSVNGALNPNWMGRLGWDFGVIALVLVDAMVLPFQMAYKHGSSADSFDTFWLVLTTAFFSMDMIISFFTAYVAGPKDKFTEPGRLVTRRCRILRHYLRGWFTIDFVSTIPWSLFADLIAGGDDSGNSAQMAKLTKVIKFIRFLRLMRMLRLAKLGVIWERIEAKMGSLILLQIVALIRVLFIVVSICHWNACIWWMVGQPSSLITDMMSEEAQADWQAKPHWTVIKRSYEANGEQFSWLEKERMEAYVFCFYWTLGVMRTMPSEVHPTNVAERVYVMLFMFFAVSAFAISVTLITQAFLKIGERRRIFNEDMAFARMHLRNIQASEQLQMKVKSYLVHLFNRRRIQAKEANLFGQLPPQLTKLMKFYTIVAHLKKLDHLRGLGKRAMYMVSEIAEVTDLVANERLCTRGKPAQATFIVVHGFLKTIDDRRNLSHRRGSEGLIDGESQTIIDEACLSMNNNLSEKTVIARTACEVIVISRRKFINLLKDNQNLFAPVLYRDMQNTEGRNSQGSAELEVQQVQTELSVTNMPSINFQRMCSYDSVEEEGNSPNNRTVTKSAMITAVVTASA